MAEAAPAPPETAPDLAPVAPFLDHLEVERRVSAHTLDAYRRDLAALCGWAAKDGAAPESLDGAGIRAFVAAEHLKRYTTLGMMALAAIWAPAIDRFPGLFAYLQQAFAYVAPPLVAVFAIGMAACSSSDEPPRASGPFGDRAVVGLRGGAPVTFQAAQDCDAVLEDFQANAGAVAFAGESISFPLTSDGAAIAQFFRGLTPNDMAVGGTAIARALGSAQNLLERDPLSKNHERVLVLVTDGEDLEGDPVQVAREAASSGIRVEVVQIGGQTPEPIPELDDEGRTLGMRRDSQGRIMTTQLSAEGEAQLLQIASEGQGELVKASAGQTGIDQMTARLRRLMTEELSERVETVYADVFQYPLALAIVLLMAEVWIGTAPKRRFERDPPKGPLPRRRRRAEQRATILLVLCGLGCEQVHPLVDDVFVRESPEVNAAIEALSKQEGDKATQILTEYLETGPCEEGSLGVGERARERQHAAFDLALALSQLAHKDAGAAAPSSATGPGAPPGMPPSATPPAAGMNGPAAPKPSGQESMLSRVSCALRLLGPLSIHREFPAALRARSHYLAGNLEMLRTDYEAAIESYDQALLLAPGVSEGAGDSIGAKIAHNRALALRLLQEQKKQEEQEKQQNQDQESGDDDKPEQDDPGEEPKKEPEQEDNQEPEQPEQNEQAEQAELLTERKKEKERRETLAESEPAKDVDENTGNDRIAASENAVNSAQSSQSGRVNNEPSAMASANKSVDNEANKGIPAYENATGEESQTIASRQGFLLGSEEEEKAPENDLPVREELTGQGDGLLAFAEKRNVAELDNQLLSPQMEINKVTDISWDGFKL